MNGVYDIQGNIVAYAPSYYEELAKQKLSGRVLISLGDSYTVGMKTRFDAIAEKYGMIHDPRGVSGSAICNKSKEYDQAKQTFVERTDVIVSDYTEGYTIDGKTYETKDVGIITFMGGANDGATIADWIGSGINETDLTTIYGALNYIFNILQETFENAKIICITQPSFYNMSASTFITSDVRAQEYGFDSMAQALVLSDPQFTNYCMALKEEAVKKTAWAYELPILDLFHTYPSVLNPYNRTKYWLSDMLHPTQTGYEVIREAIDNKILELAKDKRAFVIFGTYTSANESASITISGNDILINQNTGQWQSIVVPLAKPVSLAVGDIITFETSCENPQSGLAQATISAKLTETDSTLESSTSAALHPSVSSETKTITNEANKTANFIQFMIHNNYDLSGVKFRLDISSGDTKIF